jgi:hypothetical protein
LTSWSAVSFIRAPDDGMIHRLSTNNCEIVMIVWRIWGLQRDGYEEFYLLGFNTVRSVGSQPTFRRKMLSPSSNLAYFWTLEDGSVMFLQNVCWLSTDYATLYLRRQNASLWGFVEFMSMYSFIRNDTVLWQTSRKQTNPTLNKQWQRSEIILIQQVSYYTADYCRARSDILEISHNRFPVCMRESAVESVWPWPWGRLSV